MSSSPPSLHPRSHSPKGRSFYSRPVSSFKADGGSGKRPSGEVMARSVRKCIVGGDAAFSGPFGKRRVVYCDYVASGRAVTFIEDFIRQEVLPLYGNTHTTTTATSLQTTHFRDEARDVVRNAVNASEEDAVVFVGAGATAALHKVVRALRPRMSRCRRTVVLAGVMEHHSSLLPWRDLPEAEVVTVPEDKAGKLDAGWLEEKLRSIRQEEEDKGAFTVWSVFFSLQKSIKNRAKSLFLTFFSFFPAF